MDHKYYGGIYRPALLDVADAGGSFEVLVMDAHLRVQIFSYSNDGGGGRCGAMRTVTPLRSNHERMKPYGLHTSPAIIGRAVHYLCHRHKNVAVGLNGDGEMFFLAVHADDVPRAEPIELPEGCLCHDGAAAAAESLSS